MTTQSELPVQNTVDVPTPATRTILLRVHYFKWEPKPWLVQFLRPDGNWQTLKLCSTEAKAETAAALMREALDGIAEDDSPQILAS